MALLTIQGAMLPTPSEYEIGIMDISKAERNANGTMIIERITTKRKISVKYKFVTKDQLSLILTLLQPVFWDVTFTNPMTDQIETSSFYVGDRNMGIVDIVNGEIRYQDLSFELIER